MQTDNTEIYEKEIRPLLQKIKSICNENKIPFFTAFGTKLEHRKFQPKEGIKCMALLPEVMEMDAVDGTFADLVNVINGYKAVKKEQDFFDVD